MTFAEVVKLDKTRRVNAVWLEVGDREVCHNLKRLDFCLIGRWEFLSVFPPCAETVKRCIKALWELKGGLSVYEIGRGLLLFEFDSRLDAESVPSRGNRWFL